MGTNQIERSGDVLTPETFRLIRKISELGSFAAAAREIGVVPSALTYRVRQIEERLDVLLFDRRSRQAKLTAAGQELLREGDRLLADLEGVANRVKRVATGWEPQLTIAVDSIVNETTVLEMCEAFFALDAPTRLRIRSETLAGTLETLTHGRADLAIGIVSDISTISGLESRELGMQRFVFAVAPHHPLASAPEPITDDIIRQHRTVVAADSVQQGPAMSVGVLQSQNVLTVTNMETKLQAQVRGLGCGFLPLEMARPYLNVGRLVARDVVRQLPMVNALYAWRKTPGMVYGRALQWWLEQLKKPVTRAALMNMSVGPDRLSETSDEAAQSDTTEHKN